MGEIDTIGWNASHQGPLQVFLVGLATGSTCVEMRGQSLRFALTSAYSTLTGKMFDGREDDLMIQYYWPSEEKPSMLVVTTTTKGRPWYEVCSIIDKRGAFLEVHEDGWVKVGKIVDYEWINGELALNTPKRVQRREEDPKGKWTSMEPNPAPFVVNPCCVFPFKDTKDWYDFQLNRPGCWAVIRVNPPAN